MLRKRVKTTLRKKGCVGWLHCPIDYPVRFCKHQQFELTCSTPMAFCNDIEDHHQSMFYDFVEQI